MTLSTTASSTTTSAPGRAISHADDFGALVYALSVGVHGALVAPHADGDGDASPAAHAQSPHGHAKAVGSMQAQGAFHDDIRKLWEDHVTWTRLAIVTLADGSAGFEATAARMPQNQQHIGDAIKPFYGETAGEQLTALLTDHIALAVELLEAAKTGDTTAFDTANLAWYAYANDIADFLAQANPLHCPQATVRAAMKGHLDQTLAEASHELTGSYAQSWPQRRDPPPHPRYGRPPQQRHHPRLPQPIPLTHWRSADHSKVATSTTSSNRCTDGTTVQLIERTH